MSNIASIQPTHILSKLKRDAHLSNAVSRQALDDAIAAWRAYRVTANQQRVADDLNIVADKLDLIINQVTQGRTRINPMCWRPLLRLENNLREAAYYRINLEPNSNVTSANDDTASEVA